MVTADALLTSLTNTGLPIIGVNIGDVNDPTTWRFDGTLTDDERATATQLVVAALAPIDPVAAVTARIDAELAAPQAQVIATYIAEIRQRPVADVTADLRQIALAQAFPPIAVDPPPTDPVPPSDLPPPSIEVPT